MFKSVKKRDGRIVEFNAEKIENDIWKAFKATGYKGNKKVSSDLTAKAISLMEKDNAKFDVETIQDYVERALMEDGYASVAKSYIIYRQKRAEVRKEKMQLLEKNDIDDVDKAFDLNALRVLKARYLKKNPDGALAETPKELFTRIATHVGLPELLYDKNIFSFGKETPWPSEEFDPVANDGKYSVGNYKLSRYHLDAFKRLYDRLNKDGKMLLPWSKILDILDEGGFAKYGKAIDDFFNAMVSRRFMPNTPAIANFGKPLGMGSACFVMDVEDSMDSIMDTLKNAAMVFKSGGGVGYNFTKLRPEGDFVTTTHGTSSGPVTFIKLFDSMTDVIKQGGIRRGANMGILNINHPDIEKFITAKAGNQALKNFNISVLVMPDFWSYYERNEPYPLRNPRTNEVMRTVNPRMLFDRIVYQAWESAEPGVIFYDNVNKYNPLYEALGPIVTTNPCGEVLLYPNESCNLGSINVWEFCRDIDGEVRMDWASLEKAIWVSTKFLDNIIDINKYPLKQIEEMTLATRKIGLGVMGVGDLLYELSLPYNSEEGRAFMEKLMEFVNYHSKKASIQLARERGSFPYYGKSFFANGMLPFSGFENKDSWSFDWASVAKEIMEDGLRNCYTTIIAPTGSISMIAGCSSGMEPVYSLVFEKNVKVGSFYYTDPVFEKRMAEEGLLDEELMKDIRRNGGSINGLNYVPGSIKKVFVTAMDITPENHIRALASFQKWVDSSISKTNNFPATATVEDMRASYLLAYKLGCKDVTVYRDKSIKDQVLVASKEEPDEAPKKASTEIAVAAYQSRPMVTYQTAKATSQMHADHKKAMPSFGQKITSCPTCSSDLSIVEGCSTCNSCGWGNCSL
ncbi:MAG: adenosylcobalamin-dependent ribonucleoside-diphosphate reductase [Candidatus Aenigmarchaeota archaeon]|nr:adenosylcobalamin-dependent ribonucleoside-diphosphate reductase [Candidatus Aenigmarchaeota archaeon]